jgi:hypothetical protein
MGCKEVWLSVSSHRARWKEVVKWEVIHNLLYHYYMTFGSIPTPALRIPNPVGAQSKFGAAPRT